MENIEETYEVQEEPKLVVTEEMRSYFYDMAKWASFLAIAGFVFAGLTTIAAFTIGASVGQNIQLANYQTQLGPVSPLVFTIVCLIGAFAIFYPSLLLFKYASKAKQGVLYGDQGELNEAISKLKSLFQFWGILTILYIGSQLILFIAAITANFAKI